MADYREFREVKSQVLAWLGDEGSYVEDQELVLASKTYSWRTSSDSQRDKLTTQLGNIIVELGEDGLAEAASPYRLTALGQRSRLAGIGPKSCLRVATYLQHLQATEVLISLVGISSISEEAASLIAAIVFEVEEVVEWSLWFRKNRRNDEEGLVLLRELMSGERDWPYDDPLFLVDLQLFISWIRGVAYSELGKIPPVFGGQGPFGSDNSGKRAADAAEQLARLSYPASWSWGAVVAMLGEDGDMLPGWIRRAIEYGVPTETAVEVIRNHGVSRAGAVLLSDALPPQWELGETELLELTDNDLRNIGLTEMDRRAVGVPDDY